MGMLIVWTGLLAVLLVFELRVRLAWCLAPRRRFSGLSRLQHSGLRSLLAVAKTYGGFRIRRDSQLREPLPERFLLLANHQSLVDIPVLVHVFPRHNVRFVAKKELGRRIPAISFTLRKAGHALIDRQGNFRQNQKELVKLARLSLREAVCPAVFPEGTRSRDGKVQAFHTAAVRTLQEHNPLPALSVAVDGGWRVARLRDLLRNLRGCVYRVRLLSLYPPPLRKGEVQEILRQAREEIERQVEQWRRNAS